MSKLLIITPRISEKAYGLSEQNNTYVFNVPKEFNRHDVAKGVATRFEVKVRSVRLASTPSKPLRRYKRGGRVLHKATSKPVRKAYVTLAEGEKLPFFTEAEKTAKETKK